MTKYSTNTNNNNKPSNSCCFASIFKRFACTGNLPTHASPPDTIQTSLEKPLKCHLSLTNNVEEQVNVVKPRAQTQATCKPGVIAKLMGLETLPNYEKSTTLDSLFRSKSLNSLHFLPDFDPTRTAFHCRARTSASFHEQGHKFLVSIDEKVESDGLSSVQESNVVHESRRPIKKEVVLKEKSRQNGGRSRTIASDSRKKYEECYTNGANTSTRRRRSLKKNVNNSSKLREREKCAAVQKRRLVKENNVSKRKIGHSEVMCIEANQSDRRSKLFSRSPVSVLDDHKEMYQGHGGQKSSSSRRKSTPKSKTSDNLLQDIIPKSKQNYEDCTSMAREHELVKAEGKVEDYFVEMLGYICKLAEDHTISETNWTGTYNSFKVHFVEELTLHLGREMLDLLLDELLHDIMIMLL